MHGQAVMPETRIPRWLRLIVTIAVDAGAGFATANPAVGIAASSLAWTMLKSKKKDVAQKESSLNPSILSMTHIKDKELGSSTNSDMGYIHNQVLVNLYDKYGESMFDFSPYKLVNYINIEIAKITGKSLKMLNAQDNGYTGKIKNSTKTYITNETLGGGIGYNILSFICFYYNLSHNSSIFEGRGAFKSSTLPVLSMIIYFGIIICPPYNSYILSFNDLFTRI